MADFLYTEAQMSGRHIDKLMTLITECSNSEESPFADHDDLYRTIDAIEKGEAEWECFGIQYTGPRPENREVPSWMDQEFHVWHRNPDTILSQQLSNPDFAGEVDYAPKQLRNIEGKRVFIDFMTGDWAWQQAVSIFQRYL